MSRLIVILTSFLSLTFCIQVLGQAKSLEDCRKIVVLNKGDTTEVNARNALFRLLLRADANTAKEHLDEAMRLGRKLKYDRGIAVSYGRYSILYTSYGNYERAILMADRAEAIFSKLKDTIGINSCMNNKANAQISLGNYDKALELYIQSEKLNERMNRQRELAKAKHNISLVHYTLQDFDKAQDYLEQALKIAKEIPDSASIMMNYNGLGAVLSAQGKHQEAIVILKEALRLSIKQNNLKEKASIGNNIGAQYYYQQQFDSTRYYYKLALKNYQLLNAQRYASEVYSNLGEMELQLGNYSTAKLYYDSCLVIAEQSKAAPIMVIAYQGLSEVNSRMNNAVVALEWYKKYHLLNDSIVGERVKNNINELQIKYDAGKKDLKIAELEKSRLQSNINEQKDRQLIIIIVSATLILIVLLILLFIRRNALVRERANNLEQKVFRAQMNPHFIFNSLNSIQRMYVEGDEDRANDYMADFSRLLRSILENSGKNRITLKEELELTSNYLELEKLRSRNLFDFEIELNEDIDPLHTKVPPLIFQPYIENAIWHGIMPKKDNGHIQLSIQRNNGHLVCEISDDGVGFDPKSNQNQPEGKTSQGMAITAERLGGEQNVKLETIKGGGTSVTIKMEV